MTIRIDRCRWTAIVGAWVGLLLSAAQLPAQVPIDYTAARNRLVDKDIAAAGVTNPRVIEAMRKTPRHEFVPKEQRHLAYWDMALPIGNSQTISPPFIVAYMTEQLEPQPTDRVLEIGTGSGYQAAVFSGLVKDVYTIEIVESLGRRAAADLKRLGYTNVHTKIGDGYKGWPEEAPFDKIIVTCSPEHVPSALTEQLKEGGRMIIPVGERYQQVLHLLKKTDGKLVNEALRPTLVRPHDGRGRKTASGPPRPGQAQAGQRRFRGNHRRPAPAGRLVLYPPASKWLTEGRRPLGKELRHVHQYRDETAVLGASGLRLRRAAGQATADIPLGPRQEHRPRSHHGRGARPSDYLLQREPGGRWRGVHRPLARVIRLEGPDGPPPRPPETREAIARIGLFGATGEISMDNIRLEASVPGSR